VRPVLIFALTVTVARPIASQEVKPSGRPSDSLLAFIDRFLNEPTHYARFWRAILDSAEARPDVRITISPSVVPWLCGMGRSAADRKAFASLLLGAFVAGNMRQQLISKKKGDQPQSGMQAVVHVYKQVRGRLPAFTDSIADRWVALDSTGEFPRHADSVAAYPMKECP